MPSFAPEKWPGHNESRTAPMPNRRGKTGSRELSGP